VLLAAVNAAIKRRSEHMKIKGLRWYVAGLICLTTALNYMDRTTLSLLAQTLENELGITTREYSYLLAAFLTSYTIMYAVSGRVIDYLGTRRGYAVFVAAWSVADVMHVFARTVGQFAVCRFCLGAAEPGNFPAGVKAVSEWFPIRERAMAVGIFNSGTAIGAAIAAPMVAWVTLHFGWRYTFVVGAIFSLLWVVLWLSFYRVPQAHPRITAEELRLIEEGQPAQAVSKPVPIGQILRTREAWGCILARLLTDPISYFLMFWIPKFLQQERGFDLKAIGMFGWIPFAGLALGNLAGGALPRLLGRRGWSLNRARKTIMGTASVMIPACFLIVTQVPNPVAAVAGITVAMFFHAAWANMTLPAEVFEKHVVGSVSGFGGAMGSLMGVIAMLLVGKAVAAGSFTPVFIVYSGLPMTAFIVVCLLIKQLGQVRVLRK
jgi:ACS family hexuronate transporter-like MFS transporter